MPQEFYCPVSGCIQRKFHFPQSNFYFPLVKLSKFYFPLYKKQGFVVPSTSVMAMYFLFDRSKEAAASTLQN